MERGRGKERIWKETKRGKAIVGFANDQILDCVVYTIIIKTHEGVKRRATIEI